MSDNGHHGDADLDTETGEAQEDDAEQTGLRAPAADAQQPTTAPGTAVARVADPAQALPVLARTTASVWLRAVAWGTGTTLRLGARVVRATNDPDAAAQLYGDLSAGVRSYARGFLGIEEIDSQVRTLRPLAGATLAGGPSGSGEMLRAHGARLLRAAADVDATGDAHPAYARILTELAPDEARILRLLAHSGPQAVVDVRAGNLIGLGSQLIAPSLNMLGSTAGLLHRDRVPIYLANLSRLGLVTGSQAEVDDRVAYQVLEAQPDVLQVIKETPRARSVHRSIELTPFGADFCAACLSAAADDLGTPDPRHTSA